jgi:hypothetical protein
MVAQWKPLQNPHSDFELLANHSLLRWMLDLTTPLTTEVAWRVTPHGIRCRLHDPTSTVGLDVTFPAASLWRYEVRREGIITFDSKKLASALAMAGDAKAYRDTIPQQATFVIGVEDGRLRIETELRSGGSVIRRMPLVENAKEPPSVKMPWDGNQTTIRGVSAQQFLTALRNVGEPDGFVFINRTARGLFVGSSAQADGSAFSSLVSAESVSGPEQWATFDASRIVDVLRPLGREGLTIDLTWAHETFLLVEFPIVGVADSCPVGRYLVCQCVSDDAKPPVVPSEDPVEESSLEAGWA